MTKYWSIIKDLKNGRVLRVVLNINFLKNEILVGITFRKSKLGHFKTINIELKLLFFTFGLTVMRLRMNRK